MTPDEVKRDCRGPMIDLPHFREPFARAKGQPRVGGLWQYYTAEASRDL